MRLSGQTKPPSTLYCRPIRVQYIKKSKDVVLEESNFFKEIQAVSTRLDGFITYQELGETMVDRNVATILSEVTDTATSCSIRALTSSKLHQYNLETAQLYTNLYNWYHMPQAVHMMLSHIY